jgi:hypothetical protein
MKKLYSVFAVLLIAVFAFSACAPAATSGTAVEPAPTSEEMPADTGTVDHAPAPEEEAIPAEEEASLLKRLQR